MTLSLIPFIRPSVTKEFFLCQKSFNCVSRVFKVLRKFQGCFKEVLRVYTESFKEVSQECFKKVLTKIEGGFKGI